MLILPRAALAAERCETPVTPLNAVWLGEVRRALPLPQIGHVFLVCPLDETGIAAAGVSLRGDQYCWLVRPGPYALQSLVAPGGRVLLLLLSPAFIAEMAAFLQIPGELSELLHAMPLPKGDAISRLLTQLASALQDPDEAEALYMEIVGQMLHLLRLRHQALQNLARHRRQTREDLLPRLLRARQFIEAHALEAIRPRDVAASIALSEYHFARLFRAAFGVSVHQYLLRLRLDEARHLLEEGEQRVTDVALMVGYSSLSAFIHAFRQRFGMKPSAYPTRAAKLSRISQDPGAGDALE